LSKITVAGDVVYDYDALQIHVQGSGEHGTRSAIIMVPTNRGIEQVTIAGEEFNSFWSSFLNDKDAVKILFEKNGVDADVADIPDDILNKEAE